METAELSFQMASELGIPVLDEAASCWLIRTNSGIFYEDYKRNGFIAIGWEKIRTELIRDPLLTDEKKNDQIEKAYPDEKRPGLVRGQLTTFIVKMRKGDYIAIPNDGGQQITLGRIIDDILVEQTPTSFQPFADNDYPRCAYTRRRKVQWIREIDTNKDIYWIKVLKAHQTISNINESSSIFLRNLYDIYYRNGTVSLTLRYNSGNLLEFASQYALLDSIHKICEVVQKTDFAEPTDIRIDTRIAISSPGFFEMICDTPGGILVLLIIVLLFGGKITATPTSLNAETTGLKGILEPITDFLNQRHKRKMESAHHAIDIGHKQLDLQKQRMQVSLVAAENELLLQEAQQKIEIFKKNQQIEIPALSCTQLPEHTSNSTDE